jgi:GTPase
MLAGAGDELQGIKRGILEIADALAINKADGDNVRKATRAVAEYRNALRLFRQATEGWEPPVLAVSALESKGMDEVWSVIELHHTRLASCGDLERKRCEQRQAWLWSMIDDGLKRHFLSRPDVKRLLPEMVAAVASESLTPTQAARRLLSLLDVETDESQRTSTSRRKRSA